MRFCALITPLLLASLVCAATPANPPASQDSSDHDAYIREATGPANLVIVGSGKDFLPLKKEAQRIAKLLGRQFSMYGRVFDGTLHETGEDDGFTGYFHRRYDTDFDGKPFLSIEKSETYPGLKPGLYIVVARICSAATDAQKEVRALRKFVPDAYVRKTEIYYGCIH